MPWHFSEPALPAPAFAGPADVAALPAPVLQRSEPPTPPTGEATVQRSVSRPSGTSPPPAGPVTRTAGNPGPQPAPAPEPDLDDLARRLYPKLKPLLRKDLWLDRERAGLLADLNR